MDYARQAAIRIQDKTGEYGVVVLLNDFHLSQYVQAFGGGWGYGKTINSPENVKAIEFFVDLFVKDKVAASVIELGWGWDGEAFAQGKAAMSTGGPWYIGFMKGAAPDLNYKLIPMPSTTPGEPVMFTYGAAYSQSPQVPVLF